MVQVAVDQIVDVVSVGHGLMAATGAVDVIGGVGMARMARRAVDRVGGAGFDDMLVEVVAMGRVEMAVVQVIDVAGVADGGVAAALAVDVGMIAMDLVSGHFLAPFVDDRACPVAGGGVSLAWANALKTRSKMCRSARE